MAVNEHALRDENATGFEVPMRLAVFVRAKMRAEFSDPVRINLRQRACEELRGLHDLARDDPQRLAAFVLAGLAPAVLLAALVEIRAREDGHFAIASRLVEVALFLDGDVTELRSEDAAMDGVVESEARRRTL